MQQLISMFVFKMNWFHFKNQKIRQNWLLFLYIEICLCIVIYRLICVNCITKNFCVNGIFACKTESVCLARHCVNRPNYKFLLISVNLKKKNLFQSVTMFRKIIFSLLIIACCVYINGATESVKFHSNFFSHFFLFYSS